MKDVFPLNTSSNCNIRNRLTFYSRPINSVYKGTESLSHLASKKWELVLYVIKPFDSLSKFKNAIKLWKPVRYPCRICQTYIPQIDFV